METLTHKYNSLELTIGMEIVVKYPLLHKYSYHLKLDKRVKQVGTF